MLNDTRTVAFPSATSARDRAPLSPPVAGVPIKSRGGRERVYEWTDDKIATLLAMREDGKRNYEIARAIGFTEQVVKLKVTELRRNGVSIPAFKAGPMKGALQPLGFRPPSERSETKRQVEARARKLELSWWARGYPQARFWVVTEHDDINECPVHGIRSNLVNGMTVGRRVRCVT